MSEKKKDSFFSEKGIIITIKFVLFYENFAEMVSTGLSKKPPTIREWKTKKTKKGRKAKNPEVRNSQVFKMKSSPLILVQKRILFSLNLFSHQRLNTPGVR